MIKAIEKAIESLAKAAEKESTTTDGGNAMKFSQAVLNLANARLTINSTVTLRDPGGEGGD